MLHQNRELDLLFNIDGMKSYKSSNRTLWPILCKIYFEPDVYKPFTVALYSGTHKPKRLEEYPTTIHLQNFSESKWNESDDSRE